MLPPLLSDLIPDLVPARILERSQYEVRGVLEEENRSGRAEAA